jgi:hypothetical protein
MRLAGRVEAAAGAPNVAAPSPTLVAMAPRCTTRPPLTPVTPTPSSAAPSSALVGMAPRRRRQAKFKLLAVAIFQPCLNLLRTGEIGEVGKGREGW